MDTTTINSDENPFAAFSDELLLDGNDAVARKQRAKKERQQRIDATNDPGRYRPKLESPAWFLFDDSPDKSSEHHVELGRSEDRDTDRLRAFYLYRRQDYAEALQLFQQLSACSPKNLEWKESAARCLIHLRRFEQSAKLAEEMEEMALNLDHQAAAWNLFKDLYSAANDPKSEARYVTLLLARNEGNPHLWMRLAELGQIFYTDGNHYSFSSLCSGLCFARFRIICLRRAMFNLKSTGKTSVGFTLDRNLQLQSEVSQKLAAAKPVGGHEINDVDNPEDVGINDLSAGTTEFTYRSDFEVRNQQESNVKLSPTDKIRSISNFYHQWIFHRLQQPDDKNRDLVGCSLLKLCPNCTARTE